MATKSSYSVKPGNIFGRIGTGVGEGLAQTLPKEIERSRLASGLKQFEQESQGLTPLQQYTKLAAIPGITPEHLYTIVPLLRQQQQRAEGEKREQPTTQETAPSPIQAKAPPAQAPIFEEAGKKAAKAASLKPIEATRAQLTPAIMKSDQELYPEAVALSQQNPATYPTPNDALPIVKQAEQTRIANINEQRGVGTAADALRSRLEKDLTSLWGGEKTAKNIPDTTKTKLVQKIEDELANPKNELSERQLINKYGEAGKNLAMQDTNLIERSKQWVAGGEKTPSKIRNSINTARQAWKEADSTEEFKDRIAGLFNLSEPVANYFSDPPSNRNANKEISSLPKPKINNYGIVNPDDSRRIAILAADKITPYITDEDSILSYAMDVKKKKGDANVFFDRMQQNYKAGMFKPSARQLREFTKGIPVMPSLGDMYIFTLTDQEDLLD